VEWWEGSRKVPWSRRIREREVRRAAAWFFLIDAHDSHGSFPPSSKHYRTKGRDGCYSEFRPERGVGVLY
jgi:hypothetical protein